MPLIAQALLEGIGFGVGLAFLIGPVFFSLLQLSLEKGFRMGASMAAGVVASDFCIMLVTYLFLESLRQLRYFDASLGILGGLSLVGIGTAMTFKKIQLQEQEEIASFRKTDRYKVFTKGFLLNTLNPFAFVFWAGISSMLSLRTGFKAIHEWSFLGGLLVSVFATDLVKVYAAKKISKWLNTRVIGWTNRVSGVLLTGFGIRLLLYAFEKWLW